VSYGMSGDNLPPPSTVVSTCTNRTASRRCGRTRRTRRHRHWRRGGRAKRRAHQPRRQPRRGNLINYVGWGPSRRTFSQCSTRTSRRAAWSRTGASSTLTWSTSTPSASTEASSSSERTGSCTTYSVPINLSFFNIKLY
jgi:hypothetical protein